VLGSFGLALSALGACKGNAEAAAAPPARPPTPVTATTAQSRDVPIYLDEIGKTAPSELVNIQSQVNGQIMERRFEDGDELHKGQVLFVIDPRPYEAKVTEAKANLELARAQIELAKADYERVQRAARTNAVSPEDVDTKKGALDSATAQVKVNQTVLDTAQLNLQYCTITSPIEGRAGQRLVDVGNIVKLNDTNLLTIQRMSPMYVDFTVTEADLPRVRERMAKSELLADVSLPERPQDVRRGKLRFLDTAVQPAMGSIRLEAILPNEDRYLWPGQFVNVRLILDSLKDAVLIPYQCVQIGQQGEYVYVITHDDAKKVDNAIMQPITRGQRQGELVVITKGLKGGEQIVQTGQLSVTPGGPVRVLPPVGANPSTTPTAESATAPSATAPGATPAKPGGRQGGEQ
jgi:multidrug efflux system membrane fusion protein